MFDRNMEKSRFFWYIGYLICILKGKDELPSSNNNNIKNKYNNLYSKNYSYMIDIADTYSNKSTPRKLIFRFKALFRIKYPNFLNHL